MIHLTHSVSGEQVGAELAQDEEELAYALMAIARIGPDDVAVADHIDSDAREKVRAFCNALALTLADE